MTFTPTDTADYTSATGSVSLVVLPLPPSFQSETLGAGAVSFTWSTMPGRNYQVQYKTDLTQPNWSNFGGTILAINSTMTASDSLTNAQRFYRVMLLP